MMVAAVALLGTSAYYFTRPAMHSDKETQHYFSQLQNIASQVNDAKTTWKAGYNKRWEFMGREAILGQMGFKKNPNVKLPVKNEVASSIPDSFDSREQWPKCDSLKEVRDQANCGSCWAFGAAEAMSDRICIASGQKRQDRLSTQHLVSCCDSCGMGCDGGDPGAAWEYYQDEGIVSGDLYGDDSYCYPYDLAPCDHHTTGQYQPCPASVPTPSCKNSCNSKYGKDFNSDKRKAKSAYAVSSDPKAIQTEIMTNGPVEVAFTVYEDFLSYKSGVYKHTTGAALGGHAVKMIGWGTEDNTDYWLVVNSWNEDWGDKGTFKILRGSDECGIEDEVVAGMPSL